MKRTILILLLPLAMLAAAMLVPDCRDRRVVASRQREPYHRLDCEWAKRISPGNRIEYRSAEEARAAGKRACRECQP